MTRLAAALILSSGLYAQTPPEHKAPQNTSAMAQHYGHGTPPLSPMTGMDQKPFQVEPLKGHWTLLYYWADWCVPCVQEGLPLLISFANTHQADQVKFRLVAIRRNSNDEPGDWNDFHKQAIRLEQEVWHTAPSFPLVWDNTTRMTTDWGIHELPSYALIDPNGDLVKGGDLKMLEEKLQTGR